MTPEQRDALIKRIDMVLGNIVVGLIDEGDRVYLNSTNDADTLRELAGKIECAVYSIMETEGDEAKSASTE